MAISQPDLYAISQLERQHTVWLCAASCSSTPSAPCDTLTVTDLSLGSTYAVTALPSRVEQSFQVTCGGTGVAGLSVNQDPSNQGNTITLYEDGVLVSQFESQAQLTPQPQKFQMFVLLLLDLSGSVVDDGSLPTIIASAQQYVFTIFSLSNVNISLAVAAFDGRPTLQTVVDFASVSTDIITTLGTLSCPSKYCVDPSTDLNDAIVNGLGVLDTAQQNAMMGGIKYTQGVLVTFTDGTDQAHRVSDQDAANAVQAAARATPGRPFSDSSFTIGLGGEINQDQLAQIGQAGQQFAADPDHLSDSFQNIATSIANFANSFYQIDYCSPSRSGTHTLTVHVQYQGIIGSRDWTFDASGFWYGCIADPAKCADNDADCDRDGKTCEVHLETDAANCGQCGSACDAQVSCVDGVCQ